MDTLMLALTGHVDTFCRDNLFLEVDITMPAPALCDHRFTEEIERAGAVMVVSFDVWDDRRPQGHHARSP